MKEKDVKPSHLKQCNQTSEKYVMQKFNREFNQIMCSLFSEDDEIENTTTSDKPVEDKPTAAKFPNRGINYLRLKEFLIQIGMITEHSANTDCSNERVLLYDLWRILKGDEKEEIQSEDMRIFAFCIIRLYDHKRIAVDPTKEEEEHIKEDQIGFFNSSGRFVLTQDDIAKVQRHFDLFYLNRL